MAKGDVLATIGGILILAPLLGLGMKSIEPVPDDTQVSLDLKSGTYATLECIKDKRVSPLFSEDNIFDALDGLNLHPIADVRGKFRPDTVCRDSDGFVASRSNVTRDALRWILGTLLVRI